MQALPRTQLTKLTRMASEQGRGAGQGNLGLTRLSACGLATSRLASAILLCLPSLLLLLLLVLPVAAAGVLPQQASQVWRSIFFFLRRLPAMPLPTGLLLGGARPCSALCLSLPAALFPLLL